MTRKKRIYLATPYSHSDDSVQLKRYIEVTKAAAWLMKNKNCSVFSPITHSRPIALCNSCGGGWEIWSELDLSIINDWSDELYILAIPGWLKSVGVNGEKDFAISCQIPVRLIIPVFGNNYYINDFFNCRDVESQDNIAKFIEGEFYGL